jgi:hypothetical protein
LSKCSWTVQYWQWIHGRPSVMPLAATDRSLILTSGDNPEQQIIHCHTNEHELKGLCVHMNFHGTFTQHAKTMKAKFDGLARRLHQSTMSSRLARVYYDTFYLPSVRYGTRYQ